MSYASLLIISSRDCREADSRDTSSRHACLGEVTRKIWLHVFAINNNGGSVPVIFISLAETKDPKQSWHHIINHLLGKNYKSNNIPQIKVGETIISDNLMIAEASNDFLVSIGPKRSDEFDHVTPDFPENLATGQESLFTLSEISEYEVFQLLNGLKISK